MDLPIVVGVIDGDVVTGGVAVVMLTGSAS